VKIYASDHSNHVIAWWYIDCAFRQAFVAPGTAHPDCPPDTGTTG
jgi:hypothetical protein